MWHIGERARDAVVEEELLMGAPAAHPYATAAMLGLSDVACLLMAWGLGALGGALFGAGQPFQLTEVLLFVSLLVLVNMVAGLYPGVGYCPAEELRRICLSVTWVYLTVGAGAFLVVGGDGPSRASLIIGWALSLVLVPLGRAIVRALFARKAWWGCSAVVLGAGRTGAEVIRTLRRNPQLGLKPIAALDDDPSKWGVLEGIPVLGGLGKAAELAGARRIPYGILAMPGIHRTALSSLVREHGRNFPHLVVIPDLFGISSLWIMGRDFGGVLGLECRQRLLMRFPCLAKRAMDLCCALLLTTVLLLPMLVIAALIRLETPGPVFIRQWRIGRHGTRFMVWKFRSMVQNADEVLDAYLREHPEQQEEWRALRKLRRDPRVTRVGGFIRKTSLDELPQLLNVILGEMSLVGPRPIFEDELPRRSGDDFALYAQVPPGLTGLWQVSGRSDTSYAERVAFDSYYVMNWSPWLDIHLLARTVVEVARAKGAY